MMARQRYESLKGGEDKEEEFKKEPVGQDKRTWNSESSMDAEYDIVSLHVDVNRFVTVKMLY
jgi:hypothetical protein